MTCYIPVGGDLDLTKRAVDSLLIQDIAPSDLEIMLINNTEKAIEGFEDYPNVSIMDMPVRLLHGQSINFMVRHAASQGMGGCLSLHNDAMLHKGALLEMFNKYEEVKDTKWGYIVLGHGNGDACVIWNPKFFIEEHVWHQPAFLPFYYLDNLLYRTMELRGYVCHRTEHSLLTHEGSHSIKNDPVQRRMNELAFGLQGQIYASVWGGLPGQEQSNDPTANGIYPFIKE